MLTGRKATIICNKPEFLCLKYKWKKKDDYIFKSYDDDIMISQEITNLSVENVDWTMMIKEVYIVLK